MRRTIKLSILSAISLVLLAGCVSQPSPESHTGTVEKRNLTQEQVHKIIKDAGENAGWNMTEFKSNTMIAEKIDGKDSVAVTVTFSNGNYDILPENDELDDAIDSALN